MFLLDRYVSVLPEALQLPVKGEGEWAEIVRYEVIKARRVLQGSFMAKQEDELYKDSS